jgi:DNA repair protein RadC
VSADVVQLPVAASLRRSGGTRLPALGLAGATPLSDAELLALATGASVPLCGHLLVDDPSLTRLAEEDVGTFARPVGIRRSVATRLVATALTSRRLGAAGAAPGWRVRTPADVGERMLPAMRHLEREELRTLLLNTRNVVVATQTVYVGNLSGSAVRVGEVFRDAVRRQAAALVVVHNHPSGDPTPSADDLRITAELAQAGRLLDIELLDHVVVAADRWVSLRALGAT